MGHDATRLPSHADFYAFVFPPDATFSDPNIGVLCNDFTGYHDARGHVVHVRGRRNVPEARRGSHRRGASRARLRARARRGDHESLRRRLRSARSGASVLVRERRRARGRVRRRRARGRLRLLARAGRTRRRPRAADPCQPSSATYFNVSPSSLSVQHVAAGSSVAIQLTGFSTAQTSDWVLEDVVGPRAVLPQVTLDATEMNNGRTATMTISVPASAEPGATAVLLPAIVPRGRRFVFASAGRRRRGVRHAVRRMDCTRSAMLERPINEHRIARAPLAREVLEAGAVSGLVGGVTMALFATIYAAWLASAFGRRSRRSRRPCSVRRSTGASAIVVGVALHVAVSLLFGVVFAAITPRDVDAAPAIAFGVVRGPRDPRDHGSRRRARS